MQWWFFSKQESPAFRHGECQYINELRFRYVSKYVILKPHFDRGCYTLIQEIEDA